jgi:hypothetical protein
MSKETSASRRFVWCTSRHVAVCLSVGGVICYTALVTSLACTFFDPCLVKLPVVAAESRAVGAPRAWIGCCCIKIGPLGAFCQNPQVEKAAKLDRDTFGVAVGQGPWQRRLEEIGGIKPLAFGQFGEMGPGLEALLASMAKRGADERLTRGGCPQ